MNSTHSFPVGSGAGNAPARVRDMMLLTRVWQRLKNKEDKAAVAQARVVNEARILQLK